MSKLTPLQQASKNADRLKRSESARKGAATRKAKQQAAALPRDGFDVANGCPSIDPIAEAIEATGDIPTPQQAQDLADMWRHFASLEVQITIAPRITTTGLEFHVVANGDHDDIAGIELGTYLRNLAYGAEERAITFVRTHIEANR